MIIFRKPRGEGSVRDISGQDDKFWSAQCMMGCCGLNASPVTIFSEVSMKEERNTSTQTLAWRKGEREKERKDRMSYKKLREILISVSDTTCQTTDLSHLST